MTDPVSSTPAACLAASGLAERIADNLTRFTAALHQHPYWHLLPAGEHDLARSTGVFDARAGVVYRTSVAALEAWLAQHSFVFVEARDRPGHHLATLQCATRMLWNHETSGVKYSLDAARQVVGQGRWAGLKGWQLPSKDMLWTFATDAANPHRKGSQYELENISTLSATCYWMTSRGRIDTDAGYWGIDSSAEAGIFACHTRWKDASPAQMYGDMLAHGWRLVAPGGAVLDLQPDGAPAVPEDLLVRWDRMARWTKTGVQLQALADGRRPTGSTPDASRSQLDPSHFDVATQLRQIDYTPCRLPQLDGAQLTDPAKGVWELWGEDAALLAREGLVARDPARDVRRRAVAIDFGTSSTVVAMDTPHGSRELLRIGVREFYKAVEARDFENPTVLECIDFRAFAAAWAARAYRPDLDWDWMRAAHEAQSSFRDNPGDPAILSSILHALKQWALRSDTHRRDRLTDRQGHEVEIPAHTERNPVRGQPMQVGSDDPFDPIELYAWYLGMAINWRGRGIFLKYYLSFPVKYPLEVRERILASFRRGLQRSLPQSLVHTAPQVLQEFEVSGLANEPTAYAAAALPHLDVQPTEAGVSYAVFDFGGGTTDFDFGILRWATPEEETQGVERVFEQLATSGDVTLGGENLLEHLVYETWLRNLDELRRHRIQFTMPSDAQPFAGSEAFLAATQAAQTNTVMLAAKLRGFMEDAAASNLSPQIKLDLIDGDGRKVPCELELDAGELDAWLARRIRLGVEAFLIELARLRAQLPAGPVHVLLAGNGSRSRHVRALFDASGTEWPALLAAAFGDNVPEIVVHEPLPVDDSHPHAPTAKTGVALGLLRLVPGENTLLLNRVAARHDGQAPFGWYVGRLRRGTFEHVLARDTAYGEWHDLGPLQQGVFSLYGSNSPRAYQGMQEGDTELRKWRLDFAGAPQGAHLFARAVQPHTIELAAALAVDHIEAPDVRVHALE